MQVSCLALNPALAVVRQLRKTVQMEGIIGFSSEKYWRPLRRLFSLPRVPFWHSVYVMHLFTCYGLFGCLIAFVAKKTFFVLPLLIWIPKDPVSTSFLRFDLQEGHRGSPVLPSPQTRLQYISVYINICVEEYIHTYIILIQWIYCVNMLLRQIPYLIYTSQMGGMSLLQCLVREAFGIKIPVGWLLRAAAGLQG